MNEPHNDTQAIAARLTAKQIAEQFLGEKSYDSQQEILHAFTVSALTHAIERAMSAHVETLTQQVAEYRAAAGGRDADEFAVKDRIRTAEHNLLVQENARLTAENHEAHAFLTGRHETGWVMTHPGGKPTTELGKAALALSQQRDAAHAALTDIAIKVSDTLGPLREAPAQETERGR